MRQQESKTGNIRKGWSRVRAILTLTLTITLPLTITLTLTLTLTMMLKGRLELDPCGREVHPRKEQAFILLLHDERYELLFHMNYYFI